MAIVTEDVGDSIVATARVNETEYAVSTVSLLDLVGGGVQFSVADSVTVSDALTDEQAAMLRDTINVTDAAVPHMEYTVDVVDGVVVSDRVRHLGVTSFLADAMTASDAAVPGVVVVVGDLVLVSDAGAPTVYAQAHAADVVSVRDAIQLGLAYSAVDTVNITDTLTLHRVLTELLSDTINVQDNIGGGSVVVMDLLTSATASDAASHSAVTHAEASDEVVATDGASFANPLAPAWVMNTETTAMARYEGYDFESIAQYEGQLYGVNRDGLYLLDGATDAGVKINSKIERGFDDMGTSLKKRVPFVYLGYKSDGRLKLTIETLDRKVGKASYYTAVLPAYMPVNTRIIPGKGLVGAYLKFTLENVLGSDLDLDKWAADVAVSTTRRLS